MAKKSSKVTVTNNHYSQIEIPLLGGGPNYLLKPGEETSLDFDPDTPQMKAYRHVGLISIKEGDDVVPVDFEKPPLAAGETITSAPSDKPASSL